MKTHTLIRVSEYLFGTAAAALAASCGAPHGDPARPNVIYIMADDLGYADITPYGQQLIETPNLERLAAQGMLLTQCYSGCTVSAPSRASLMTGMHTGHTFIRGIDRYLLCGIAVRRIHTDVDLELIISSQDLTICCGFIEVKVTEVVL